MQFSQIVELIQENEMADAIDALSQHNAAQEWKGELVVLQRRMSEAEQLFLKQQATQEEQSVAFNKIALALLHIISACDKVSNKNQLKAQIQELYNFGNSSLQRSEYYKAIYYMNKVLQRDAQHVNALLDRGVAKCALHAFSDAIPDLQKAVELSPQRALAHYNLGIAYYRSGQSEAACSHWKQVQALDFDIADNLIETICKNHN